MEYDVSIDFMTRAIVRERRTEGEPEVAFLTRSRPGQPWYCHRCDRLDCEHCAAADAAEPAATS